MDSLIQKIDKIKRDLYLAQKNILDLEMEKMSIEQAIKRMSIATTNDTIINNQDLLPLNQKQREIVDSTADNILVVACPGSGKTHTIISRYINLVVKKNIDPNKILLITFTNKSGLEMCNRIKSVLPDKLPYYVGSLHGLCYKILQENNMTSIVLDEKESNILLKECTDRILSHENLKDSSDMIRNNIILLYEKLTSSFPINLNGTLDKMLISKLHRPIITLILKEYADTKKKENLIDFNDLMIMFCQLIKKQKLNVDFQYIFFDEYQDINPIQHYILQNLSDGKKLMVVGDDAQSIYSFRGSDINYIWNFNKLFDNSSIVTYFLDVNYRSTPSIINLFQNVIRSNPNSITKNVVSNQNEIQGVLPIIASFDSKKQQADWIALDIKKKIISGVNYKDIVILSRNNYSLNEIEYTLLKHSIPITINNGTVLLNKPHIKDLLAFLIVVVNPLSTIHWKRIYGLHNIEYNSTYIPVQSFDNNFAIYYNNLIFLYKKTNTFTKEILLSIQLYLNNLWKTNNTINITECTEDLNRMILYLMVNPSVDFINSMYLQTTIDIESMDNTVLLSTIHGSKGLEWKHVYIVDMTSRDFPNIKNAFYTDMNRMYEEERRLFYVACSRAIDFLTITSYQDIDIMISPFIRTIDPNLYIGSNLTKQLAPQFYNLTGNINEDVRNYIQHNDLNKVFPLINTMEHKRNCLLQSSELGHSITISQITSSFLNILIYKMILNKYNVNNPIVSHYKKIPDSIYANYIDRLVDWKNILPEIFYIAIIPYKHKIDMVSSAKELLLDKLAIIYYENLEKVFLKYLASFKPKKILLATNCSNGKTKGEIRSNVNILIDSNTLIELKTSTKEACSISTLCQTIMKAYLLNGYPIDNIIVFNPSNCIVDSFIISKTDNIFSSIKKLLYDNMS
jgi:DNA helicase-2/ATP-dependent DNA helicase PcrA